MSSVGGLVAAHFDFDSNGWLAFLADLNLLVVSLDTGSVMTG